MPASRAPAVEPVATRTQVERRRSAEARLLATAREIVSRKGWAGTTLAEVGETAGYSRGLAGHYFGNKAGLLRALTEQINNSFMAEMSRAPPPRAGLASVIAFAAVYLGRKDPRWTNTRVLLLLLTEALLDGSENAEQMTRFNASMFRFIEEHIRVGIRDGDIRPDVSPTVGAEFVVGVLRGLMIHRLVKGGDIGASVLSRQVQDLIANALSVRVGPRGGKPASGAATAGRGIVAVKRPRATRNG